MIGHAPDIIKAIQSADSIFAALMLGAVSVSTWPFPVVCLLFQSYCMTSSEFAPISVTQTLFSRCTLSFTERGSLSNILQRHMNSMRQQEAVFSSSAHRKLTAEASYSTLRCRDPGSPVCTTEVHFQCELQPFAEGLRQQPTVFSPVYKGTEKYSSTFQCMHRRENNIKGRRV